MAKESTVKEAKVTWAAEPEEQDYPAAGVFLGLVLSPERVSSVVDFASAHPDDPPPRQRPAPRQPAAPAARR